MTSDLMFGKTQLHLLKTADSDTTTTNKVKAASKQKKKVDIDIVSGKCCVMILL